ncbi:MAG: P22 phage major capsid protein family protein, partial [Gammaproteobacteria bacterium]
GTASTPYSVSLAYVKDAFTFGTVDLPEYPDRPCSRRVYDGISMRVAQGSDMINDIIMMRFDIMAAFGALRPELACRLAHSGSLSAPDSD